jgi:predicted RNA methylase
MARKLAAGTPLTDAARTALETIEHDPGPPGGVLRLTVQLDRPDYEQVQAVFDRVAGGGRWHRASGTHRWPDHRGGDLEVELKAVLAAGVLPPDPRKVAGWFATPEKVAGELAEVALSLPGWYGAWETVRVLEPSAGEGALADALHGQGVPTANILCVEPDPWRAALCRSKGYPTIEARFQDVDLLGGADGVLTAAPFDVVLMNPPFTEPGDSRAWIAHLRRAWALLAGGGRLVCVVPRSIAWADGSREKDLVRLHGQLTGYGADIGPLPDDAYRPSATGIHASVVVVDRPEGEDPAPFPTPAGGGGRQGAMF